MDSTKQRPWFDPLRWSWLVVIYGLFLIIATLTEYVAVVDQVFTPWLSRSLGAVEVTSMLPWLLLPLMASQALTLLWLRVGVRVRAPAKDRALALALECIVAHARGRQRLRIPRVVAGVVSQPRLVSVFGWPLLVLPMTGLRFWYHGHLQSRAEAEAAFSSVIAHELGHLETCDDMLFLPWFTYWTTAVAVCGFGVWRWIEGRLDGVVPFGHLALLAGLGVMGVYVIRRREAYADAYAVVTTGSERPIRNALAALAAAPAMNRGPGPSYHFRPAIRLRWLEERGRPLLDMTNTDLGLVAMIYLTIGARVFGHSLQGGGVQAIHGLLSVALDVFTVLTIAGMMLARRGLPPGRRELLWVAGICLLGQTVHEILNTGVANLYGLAFVVMNIARGVVSEVVPFVFTILVLCRWSSAMLSRDDPHLRERLVMGALAFAAMHLLFDQIPTLFFARAASGVLDDPYDLDALWAFSRTVGLVMLGAPAVALSILIGVHRWSVRRLREQRSVCRRCGAAGAGADALRLACDRCGEVQRPDLVVTLDDPGEGHDVR